jgi:hypothetical protein
MQTIKLTLRAAIIAFALAGKAIHPAYSQDNTGTPASPPEIPPAAQPPPAGDFPPPPFGIPGGGPGGPGGRGPFGGPMREETKLVEKFDKDGNERLDLDERKAAREFLAKERAEGRGRRGPGGFGGPGGPGGPGGFGGRGPGDRGGRGGPGGPGEGPDRGPRAGADAPPGAPRLEGAGAPPRGMPFGPGGNRPAPSPGPKVTPEEVKSYRGAPLYDANTLRTLFLEFEAPDWEKELTDFKDTDVEVPATLHVDGKTYKDVGVHFRGASSFMMVGEGHKRSLNLSLDFVHKKQDLGGYRTLNLLNSNGDPTFLRGVLYNQISSTYIPTPKANLAKVVINGESWGVYVNVQQVNKDFVEEWFDTKQGARWKAPGRPNGNSGLEYLGDDVAKYKERFEIKSKDDPAEWAALIELCRVLNQTPADQLEGALKPHLDIEGALRFLALENVFINTDGYWTRASDYNLYRAVDGRFHVIPHDTNETFRAPEGPGMRRPRGDAPAGAAPASGSAPAPAVTATPPQAAPRPEGGLELSPLAGADDTRKPLLNKLLAVPALRTRYLEMVREIATDWLDWNKIEPIAKQYQALIDGEVEKDTRKLSSTDAFRNGFTEDTEEAGFRGPRRSLSLKSFVEKRRAYLLSHPEILQLSGVSQAR